MKVDGKASKYCLTDTDAVISSYSRIKIFQSASSKLYHCSDQYSLFFIRCAEIPEFLIEYLHLITFLHLEEQL